MGMRPVEAAPEARKEYSCWGFPFERVGNEIAAGFMQVVSLLCSCPPGPEGWRKPGKRIAALWVAQRWFAGIIVYCVAMTSS
jgi:hypothetical protein